MRPPPPDVDGGSSPATAGSIDGPTVDYGPAAGYWPPFDPTDLKRAQAGDSRALGRFFDHYCDRIFSVVYRFTGSLDLAKDLTQNIFFKVRRHLGRLDLERDLAPWLYTVTVNACHDHRRSAWWRMSRHSVPLDHRGIGAALSNDDSNPERAVMAAEDERRIQWAIGRLPPELRVSVILHDFEGLGHEAIAGILHISHSAARKRHSRALRALAGLLKEKLHP